MDTNQTLHDFVLNLITNQDARLAFELDPETTLQAAGLGDLTPADVQDVVPLVVDLVPVQGLTGLIPAGQDLGLGGLTAAPATVVGQLQGIVDQLPVGGSHSATADLNVAALGAITVQPTGFGGSTTVQSGGDVEAHPDGTAPLPAGTDVAHTLDAGIIAPGGGEVSASLGGSTSADLGGSLGGTLDLVGGLTGGLGGTLDVVGGLTGSVGGTLDVVGGVTGGLGVGDLGGTVGTVTGVTDDLTGTVDGVTGSLGLGGGITGDLTGSLGVGNVTGALGLGGSADTSSNGGLLDLTDGLL